VNIETERFAALAVIEAGADVPEELFPTWFNGWVNGENRPELTHLARSPFSHTSLPALVGLLRENAEVLLAHEGSRAMRGSWLGSAVDESSTMLTALDGLRAVRPLPARPPPARPEPPPCPDNHRRCS